MGANIKSIHHSIFQLVRDTRSYLEQSFVEFPKKQTKQIHPILKPQPKPSKKEIIAKNPSKSNDEEIALTSSKRDREFKKREEPKTYSWELQPMAQPCLSSAFAERLSKYLSLCTPAVPVRLILPEEIDLHRLFLESLARAITSNCMPASVILWKKDVLQDPSIKHILAPVSILKKNYQNIQPHQAVVEKERVLIPMEPLDLYLHDITSKRALWKIIQHSFRS